MITAANNIGAFLGTKSTHDAWIAEAIWGHRIERQPYGALMLEFLGMAEGMFRQGELFAATLPHENPMYVANQSLEVRNLLFNNPRMEEILRDTKGDDDAAWKSWLAVMENTASLRNKAPDFSYLRGRFDTFAELVSVIRLLRRITVDPGSERSWTMQFVFPIGPAALYEAMLEKGEGFERPRRVFTRTGELVYLMLSRASESVRAIIRERLATSFDANTARNKLIMRLIATPVPDRGDAKGGTYLPYKTHPAFDRMAEDVAAIFRLDLPDQDAFQYLRPLLGFHLYLYGLETANHSLGDYCLPPIICEILAPKSDLVRKAATASYLQNDGLGNRAMHKYVSDILAAPELRGKLNDASLDDLAKRDYLIEHLARTCAFKSEQNKDQVSSLDPLKYEQEFYSFADRLYRNGAGDGLNGLVTGCGLASNRETSRYRYAPKDELFRVLVLATVTSPMEESAFLRLLHKRYRIVIGPIEGKDEVLSYLYDDADFKKNRDRFVRHLIGMGLAQRMSDDCTYVINPMDPKV